MVFGSIPKVSAALLATTLCSLMADAGAKKFLQFEPITKEDVERSIADELSGAFSPDRLHEIEQKLQVVYAALPKNDLGRLNHQAVRYVLHRFFVQQHGWYVRGLEPNGLAQNAVTAVHLKDWVAAYTLDRFEEQANARGLDLRGLAALAATLEDLIRKEASLELKEVYSILNFSTDERLPREQADEAIHTYMMVYLTNRNVSLSSRLEAERKLKVFAKKYKGSTEAEAFLQSVEARHGGLSNPAGVDFQTAADVVADAGERYGSFNDGECRDLKTTLVGMASSSGKLGRVGLHELYNMSLHTHWKFSEKADFLRELGALDESASHPSVIIPNYLSAFTNCLKATSLYAVCCRNECEDLLGHLESQIAGPTATPETIAKLVSALPSESVPAPRRLQDSLMRRLSQMAESSGGQVHLHGRLFAQWMHHAYPLECPYPHAAGTTTPQTASEWMERTGSAAHASEEEMRKVVEDTCAATGCEAAEVAGEVADGAEEPELPWSDAEELLVPTAAKGGGAGARLVACSLALVLAAVGWLAVERLDVAPEERARLRKVLLFAGLLIALSALDLVDVALFVPLASAVILLVALRHVAMRPRPAAKADKCLV